MSVVRLNGVSRRSSLLLAAVDLLFEDGGIGPAQLDQIVVTRGPGSFTGIRAGLATALGLARSTGAEILAYDSLLAQAARVGIEGEIWAAQPGKRGEFYAQPFALAHISHQLPAAADDASPPAAFSRIGMLSEPTLASAEASRLRHGRPFGRCARSLLSSTTPRPSGQKLNRERRLPALATKPGEKCGLNLSGAPQPRAELRIVAVADAPDCGVWIAAESLDLGAAVRVSAERSAAEALLRLAHLGVETQSVEPLYFEDPPVVTAGKKS